MQVCGGVRTHGLTEAAWTAELRALLGGLLGGLGALALGGGLADGLADGRGVDGGGLPHRWCVDRLPAR